MSDNHVATRQYDFKYNFGEWFMFKYCNITHPLPTAILISTGLVSSAAMADSFNCSDFQKFGGNIQQVQANFKPTPGNPANPEKMAWNWFVCLNNDVSSQNKKVRLWETFKPSEQVYLPNGAAPGSYLAGAISHQIDSVQQVDGLALEMGGQVPPERTGQPVRFQLLMNQNTFDYIVNKNVYNLDGQKALLSNLNFPPEAWELKTSWIFIGDNKPFLDKLVADGYYITTASYTDINSGKKYTGPAALSGMHVINKLFKDWVWSTFENINNAKYTVTKSTPPTPMHNATGPTANAATQNTIFHKANPRLSSYNLVGVQWINDTAPAPALMLLANSQLESAFQNQSSCMACHATAAYSAKNGHFNFALRINGGISYPVSFLPDSEFNDYYKLDSVWSLKRAQWNR
ncbi:hypothetical protein AAKU55_001601 [Oxalobacteraceae bacterium GrIS 1.11]